MDKKSFHTCVLGIDADVSKMGWCITDFRTGKPVLYGKYTPKLKYFFRTIEFYEFLNNLIVNQLKKGMKFKLAGIEDYGHQFIANNQARKGGVVDVLKLCLWQNKIPIMFYYPITKKKGKTYCVQQTVGPSQLSKFIFGTGRISTSGKSSKLQLQCFKETGWEFSNDDITDAFYITQMLRAYLTEQSGNELNLPVMTTKGEYAIMKLTKNRLEPINKWKKFKSAEGV